MNCHLDKNCHTERSLLQFHRRGAVEGPAVCSQCRDTPQSLTSSLTRASLPTQYALASTNWQLRTDNKELATESESQYLCLATPISHNQTSHTDPSNSPAHPRQRQAASVPKKMQAAKIAPTHT